MVLIAAILLIVVVMLATVLTVGSDVVARKDGERLVAFKDWQGLIGAVLGFMGAAGVLVLGTAIETEQERQRAAERQQTIGYALALEAERLSNGMTSLIGIANLINASPEQDYKKTCTEFVATMTNVLLRDTPVFTAALDKMIEFGNDNLSVFVRFYGVHDELVEDAGRFDLKWCDLDPKGQIAEYERRLRLGLEFYRIIAGNYGTAIVEPLDPGPGATSSSTETDAPGGAPMANANTGAGS